MMLLCLLLAIFGFALFGYATDAHHQRRFGRRLPPLRQRRMRAGAWAALAAAFPFTILARGWVFGPILWCGSVMVAAGILFIWLNLWPAPTHREKK